MNFDLLKTVIETFQFFWFAFLILLAVSAVLLFIGSKARYVVGMVAFAIPATLSLAFIVGISFADVSILDFLATQTGTWITILVPQVVKVTAWPWITLAVSGACIAALFTLNKRAKKVEAETEADEEPKATGEEKIEPAFDEGAKTEVEAEADRKTKAEDETASKE